MSHAVRNHHKNMRNQRTSMSTCGVKKSCRKLIIPKTIAALATLTAALSPGPTETADAARVYRDRVNPQWAIDNSHFWYRNDLAQGTREFVLVNLKKGTREPAFDGERLAKALLDAGTKGIEAGRLPMDQLQFDVDRNLMYFRARGQHFQWNRKTHKLKKIEAEENMDPAILTMWATSMQLSPKYGEELRAFWALPEDFTFSG